MTNPYAAAGHRGHIDGNKDAYFAEGGAFQKWDAAKQAWEIQGNVIDLAGKSKNCAWDQAAAVCK